MTTNRDEALRRYKPGGKHETVTNDSVAIMQHSTS